MERQEVFRVVRNLCNESKEVEKRSARALIGLVGNFSIQSALLPLAPILFYASMLILQLHEKDSFSLSDRKLTQLLIAKHAGNLSAWMDGDKNQRKYFPERTLFRLWANEKAPAILQTAEEKGRSLPKVLPTLLSWYTQNRWAEVFQYIAHALEWRHSNSMIGSAMYRYIDIRGRVISVIYCSSIWSTAVSWSNKSFIIPSTSIIESSYGTPRRYEPWKSNNY